MSCGGHAAYATDGGSAGFVVATTSHRVNVDPLRGCFIVNRYCVDLLREACGLPGPLSLEIARQDGSAEPRRVLAHPFAVIGRDPAADVPLDHEDVGRRHAYLQAVGGRVFCVDLSSRTGTQWPGGPGASGWLGYGRPIRIGPFLIRLADELPLFPSSHDAQDDRARGPLSSRQRHDDLPQVTLDFHLAGSEQPAWAMHSELALVGSARGCHVRLKSDDVSRFHCAVLRTTRGVWVIDLQARGGVSVNGAAARFARLTDGDEVRVGKFTMRLRTDASEEPAGAWGMRALPRPGSRLPALVVDGAGRMPSRVARAGIPAAAVAAGGPPAEWMSAGMELKGFLDEQPAERAELIESVLPPLFRQIGLMQQQMSDQFQQAVMTMFQMYSTMHHDELGSLREELERLRDAPRVVTAAAPCETVTSGPDRVAAQAKSATSHGPDVVADAQPYRLAAPPPVAPPSVAQSSPVHEPAAPKARPMKPAPAPAADAQGQRPDGELHVLLAMRLADLQREQQTRWQRILQFVVGRPQGEVAF